MSHTTDNNNNNNNKGRRTMGNDNLASSVGQSTTAPDTAATPISNVSKKKTEITTSENLGGSKRSEQINDDDDDDDNNNNNSNNNNVKSRASSASTNENTLEKKSVTAAISIDASSTCSSSQDEATSTIRRRALHITIDNNDNNNNHDDRGKRIQGLILHRSMLLDRVKACRKAAQKSIGELSSKNQGGDELTDDEEIAAFRTMTKKANQAARKSRGDGDASGGGGTETRTSLSLRRGSTVGKRMNAALSSLVPGSNANNNSNNNINMIVQKSISVGDTVNLNSVVAVPSSSSSNDITSKTVLASTTTKVVRTETDTEQNNRNPKLNNVSSQTIQYTKHQPGTQQKSQPRGRPPSNKNNKGLNRMSGQWNGIREHASGSNATSSDRNTKKGIHPTAGGSALIMAGSNFNSHSNLSLSQSVSKPKVQFPEAILLREKRDRIQSKLKTLLERRHSNDPSLIMTLSGGNIMKSCFDDEGRRAATKTSGGIGNKPLSKTKISFVDELDIQSPVRLPQRRKTHWDTLLQEMSWLASDFIEERKWKLSTARLLSSKIPIHEWLDRRKKLVDVSNHDASLGDLLSGNGGSNTLRDNSLKRRESNETEKSNKSFHRRYNRHSIQDDTIAKSNSQILSCMISELNVAIQRGGSFQATDQYHCEALNQFVSARSDILKKLPTITTTISKLTTAPRHLKNSVFIKDNIKQTTTSVNSSEVESEVDSDSRKESIFDTIDCRINQIHNVCKSKIKLSTKDMTNPLKVGKIVLTSKQREVIDYVDKLWFGKPFPSGAMLVGPTISGKTFSIATIIYRQRTKGPQLLICPSRSMVRWKHELDQFSNIRILTYGSTSGISNPDSSDDVVGKIKSTDVFICDYSMVNRIKTALNEISISLFSIVIDLRHFLGLRLSIGIPSVPGVDREFPPELISNSWWDDVVTLSKNKDTRCLFIDYCDSDPLFLSKSCLGHKEQITILAKRVACMIGSEVGDTNSHSIQQQILVWARKKGKNDVTDKIMRVRKVLNDVIDPMRIDVESPIISSVNYKCDIRPCSMNSAQREEYEKCCYSIRGALSSTLPLDGGGASGSSTISVVANALLRLRQHCSYTKGLIIHPKTLLNSRHPSTTTDRYRSAENSSSQPDFENACSILKNAPKLQELVSILIEEGCYDISCEGNALNLLGVHKGVKTARCRSNAKDSPKKVAIFASLPNILNVVFVLLNSLGIQNELLCRDSHAINGQRTWRDSVPYTRSSCDQDQNEVITWANSQSVLSRFCDKSRPRKTSIIVVDPSIFSGLSYGLGIEGADMIITLDSDWSNKDSFILDSLVTRWRAKNKLVGKNDKMVRLVIADSVEEKLFSEYRNEKLPVVWPLDSNGFLTIPNSQDDAVELYSRSAEINTASCSSFPGFAFMKNRGSLLSDFLLSSKHLPSFLGSGEATKFLPRLNDALTKLSTEKEVRRELHFLRYFLQREQSYVSVSSPTYTLENLPIAPPLLSCQQPLPLESISCQDLPVIASRLFLVQMIKKEFFLNNGVGNNASSKLLQPIGSLTNNADVAEESDDAAIDEDPASLLFYEPSKEVVLNNDKRRCNAYAKIYSSSWDGISVRDGNQGCEPLVFFPPLLPLLQECSKRARVAYKDASSLITSSKLQDSIKMIDTVESNPTNKRKDCGLAEINDDTILDRKRLKIHSDIPVAINEHDDILSSVVKNRLADSSTQVRDFATTDKREKKFVTQVGLAEANFHSSKIINNTFSDNKSNGFIMVEEDFGLFGSGAIPNAVDVVSFSDHDARANNLSLVLSDSRFDFTSCGLPCDAEETGTQAMANMNEGLHSVLLFVKNQPKSYLGSHTPYRLSQGVASIIPKFLKEITHDESGKKRKKGNQAILQAPPTAFKRLPGSLSTPLSQILPRSRSTQTKGDHRHKLLASYHSRQKVTGLTLFDSVPFRVAAMRVERRMSARLERVMWKSTLTHEFGPGLPIDLMEDSYCIKKRNYSPRQGWDSIIAESEDESSSGDAVISLSNNQRNELRTSLVSPRRVDFGIFEVGYLASPSGMTSIATPRSRVGISLPMGVKVLQPTKEVKFVSSWNIRDDKVLQDTAKKFGMNWLLVASAMSGFEHVVINENLPVIERIIPSISRSPRQCRDRWQALAENQPSLKNEVRKSERIFRENALLRCDEIEIDKTANRQGKAEVHSAGTVSIITKSISFLSSTRTRESPALKHEEDDMMELDTAQNVPNIVISSGGSSSEKRQDDKILDNDSNNLKSASEIEVVSNDVEMSDVPSKPKRRQFSAISAARSKRRILPMSIPGVVPGSNQPSHPVPSHPSHMQAVQSSVTAQWASGRTEMWPLQILDLVDKKVQRGGEISSTSNNSSRRHVPDSTAYQHRYPPPQQQPTGNTGLPPGAIPVTSHHQHRNPPPQVAPATAQAYIPPQLESGTVATKSNEKLTKS